MDKTKVSRQHGFTLIEVLLVLALTSFMGIAVMQMMQDSANSTALSEAKFEELELARQLQLVLTYKPSCEKNLKDKIVDTMSIANIQQLVDSNGQAVVKVNDVLGNRSIKVNQLEFAITQESLDAFNTFKATWPADVTYYMLDVQFKLQLEKMKTALGGKNLNRTIPVKVKVDASNMIQECFATADAANITAMTNFCAQLGGTFNETTNSCDFNQSCATTNPAHLVPSRCIDEKVAQSMEELSKAFADLASRLPASTSSTPAPTPTPTSTDPYALPFSIYNPGPGCKGTGCWASDFGPCEGTSCKTNGGTCSGISCMAGQKTGTVEWDGKNIYTPSNPGPGCTGTGCHASDYGPCNGTSCTTNGGSCQGISCRTGVK